VAQDEDPQYCKRRRGGGGTYHETFLVLGGYFFPRYKLLLNSTGIKYRLGSKASFCVEPTSPRVKALLALSGIMLKVLHLHEKTVDSCQLRLSG
jgi:hypothetical protein